MSCPSEVADTPDSRCKRSRGDTRSWCRAPGRLGGLPSRRPPAAGTIPDRSGRAQNTRLEVKPRSRSTVRNGGPALIASRSRCRTSMGSRFCPRASRQACLVSLCARRQRVQWHPACQRADVPCAIGLTRLRVANASAWAARADVIRLQRPPIAAVSQSDQAGSRPRRNADRCQHWQ